MGRSQQTMLSVELVRRRHVDHVHVRIDAKGRGIIVGRRFVVPGELFPRPPVKIGGGHCHGAGVQPQCRQHCDPSATKTEHAKT